MAKRQSRSNFLVKKITFVYLYISVYLKYLLKNNPKNYISKTKNELNKTNLHPLKQHTKKLLEEGGREREKHYYDNDILYFIWILL